METSPTLSPTDRSIERHMPEEAHDDHGQEDGACYGEIAAASACWQALDDRADLQANEDERQDVQHENDRLPYRVCRYAYPRRSTRRRGPRQGHCIGHHGQHTREPNALGEDPYAEGGGELKNDGSGHMLHEVKHAHNQPS